jgi:hypothetical protein
MTLEADNNGRISGAFDIPPQIPVGAKRVTFKGSGGSQGVSVYTAQGWRTVMTAANISVNQLVPVTPTEAVQQIEQQQQEIINPWQRLIRAMDPVAQTHSFLSDRQVSAYDIMVARIGDRSKPIILQARNTVNGYPGPDVYAESIIDMTHMTTGRVWRRGTLALPYLGRSESSYSLVALCDDAQHAIFVAKVGGFDQERGWVGQHPYNIGSFFDGSDNKAWKVKPEYAMTFRAVARKYTRTIERIELGAIEVDKMSDLIPIILCDRPQGTEVEVEVTLPSGQRIVTAPGAAVSLTEYISGPVQVALTLRGSANLSPVVYREAQLITGSIAGKGDYVSRAFAAGTGTRATIFAEVTLPGDASIEAYIQTEETVNGPKWTKITTAPVVTPLGDGRAEYQWDVKTLNAAYTRIRFDWTGNPAARPKINNPRASVMLRT